MSKHDKISANLEHRIGHNFHKILRNHEYGDYEVIGELDRYMEKYVKKKTYAYVFEIKCNDHYQARNKAMNQLHRARLKFNRCKEADKVFLYYVTSAFIECVGVFDNSYKSL